MMARPHKADDPHNLVELCKTWCALTGTQPIPLSETAERLLRQAVADNNTPFAQLNVLQRTAIAGLTMTNI